MRRQRRALALALLIVIIAGLTIRKFLPHVWPWFSKEAGDALYAVAAYVLVLLIRPGQSVPAAAAIALAYSCAIEAFQLVHIPSLDSLRRTTPGRLVLGAGFAWNDITCYAVGVALAALADHTAHRQKRSR